MGRPIIGEKPNCPSAGGGRPDAYIGGRYQLLFEAENLACLRPSAGFRNNLGLTWTAVYS
jgi:hypothetical protein